jgi:polyisoprenoid-binding protein YceI
MQRLAILTILSALAAPLAAAQASTWVSDPNHSEVDFSILHMSVSKVHGRFGAVNATIVLNEADVTKSTVTATIGVDQRNNDLKSANFFDVANLPTASFTSTSVTKNGSKLEVAGNLTLHGVTKPVVLEVEGPTPAVADPKGRMHAGYSAETKLDRTVFGIGSKYPAAMLGDEITLDIELEVVKQ